MFIFRLFIIFGFCFQCQFAISQLRTKIKKPYYYKSRVLPVEKSYGRKYNFITRFYHNLTSRYNYYHNAKKLLDEIYEDYELYPRIEWEKYPIEYYSYDPDDVLKKYEKKLDSIILKCNAGILLHDLRSKWQDDFYYLLGQTYYLKNNLDTALLMFEFLYNSFIPDKKGNVDIIRNKRRNKYAYKKDFIVSPEYSINKIADKIRHNPKRNEALMWIIRILTSMDKYFAAYLWTQAILKESLMPSRIKPLFSEAQGYWHYKQKQYLEAAQYLAESLKLSLTREEKARRNFLIGQLYDLAGKHQLSKKFFQQSLKLTLNPELEIYARLYYSVQGKYNKDFDLDDAIKALLKLLKKARYENHHGLIYYNVALMELQRERVDMASFYLQKAIKDKPDNIGLRNKAYYLFFKIHFSKKQFIQCAQYMDSVHVDLKGILHEEKNEARERKIFFAEYSNLLKDLLKYEQFIYFHSFPDSVKRIEAMRNYIIDKQKKIIIKDKEYIPEKEQIQKSSKWYFENPYLLDLGKKKFLSIWGDIANEDNWRTESHLSVLKNRVKNTFNNKDVLNENKEGVFKYKKELLHLIKEYNINEKKNLLDSVNLTKIEVAIFFQYTLKEYDSAMKIYDQLLNKGLPEHLAEEVFVHKINLLDKINTNKKSVQQLIYTYYEQFPTGKYIPYLEKYYSYDDVQSVQDTINQEDIYIKIFMYYKQKDWLNVKKTTKDFIAQFPNSIFKYKVMYFSSMAHIYFKNYSLAKEKLITIMKSNADKKLKAMCQYYLNRIK